MFHMRHGIDLQEIETDSKVSKLADLQTPSRSTASRMDPVSNHAKGGADIYHPYKLWWCMSEVARRQAMRKVMKYRPFTREREFSVRTGRIFVSFGLPACAPHAKECPIGLQRVSIL